MNKLETHLHPLLGTPTGVAKYLSMGGFAQIALFLLSRILSMTMRLGVAAVLCWIVCACACVAQVGSQTVIQTQGRVATAGESVAERLAADLQWTPAQRVRRFGRMQRLFPVNVIPHGRRVMRLPAGRALHLNLADGGDVRERMRRDHLSALLVLHHGRVSVEQYGEGVGPLTRWTSFSVAKSFTSTLAGVAVQRGWIRSVDDAVTEYLPEMRGSAYDGVTVRELLTMSSGVRWVEAYDTDQSDNVRLYRTAVPDGGDPVVEYMRRLPRAHPPGTVWHYSTGEADLAGVLVRRVSHRSLSDLLSEAVWKPFGMQRDGFWIAEGGREFAGSGVSATLRDYGRFGLLALRGGAGAVPAGWFAAATRPAFATGEDGRGYGMGWWTFADGSYAALGIFGQSVWIDPARDLVVVMLGAWPTATSVPLAASRGEIWRAAQASVDADAATNAESRRNSR